MVKKSPDAHKLGIDSGKSSHVCRIYHIKAIDLRIDL